MTATDIDAAGYTAALDDPAYAARHRESLAEAARLDVRVAPTIVVGARRIEGVATEDVLLRALAEAGA